MSRLKPRPTKRGQALCASQFVRLRGKKKQNEAIFYARESWGAAMLRPYMILPSATHLSPLQHDVFVVGAEFYLGCGIMRR
jgi:hypothetical protein